MDLATDMNLLEFPLGADVFDSGEQISISRETNNPYCFRTCNTTQRTVSILLAYTFKLNLVIADLMLRFFNLTINFFYRLRYMGTK